MKEWKPVSTLELSGALGALVLVAWLRWRSLQGWVPVLDDANLVFHEAGHPIFGLLGERIAIYGGTMGQLVFPTIASVSFGRKGETTAFALSLAWLFENFLNIARYMADARAQILPLVGGGEHDWTDIFSRWHVLPHNLAIAGFIAALGWVGIFACGVWLVTHR